MLETLIWYGLKQIRKILMLPIVINVMVFQLHCAAPMQTSQLWKRPHRGELSVYLELNVGV